VNNLFLALDFTRRAADKIFKRYKYIGKPIRMPGDHSRENMVSYLDDIARGKILETRRSSKKKEGILNALKQKQSKYESQMAQTKDSRSSMLQG